MGERDVGVLGATSLVGECLLPLLTQSGWHVTAFSRHAAERTCRGVVWQRLAQSPKVSTRSISCWVCITPIWILPNYFELLDAYGIRRIVVLSSTSRFTKDDSSDIKEQALARDLAFAEERVRTWSESKGVKWVILRPTLIYGLGRDKNVSEIARFVRRFSFFPVFAGGKGLRQPVHAEDVASACLAALQANGIKNRDYNISGGETLSYREMVRRVFVALGRRPRLLAVSLSIFRLVVFCARWLPRYRNWSPAMAERMRSDLVFDNADAMRDLQYRPRPFTLGPLDLPPLQRESSLTQ